MQYLICNLIGTSSFNNLIKKVEDLKGETAHMCLDLSSILNLSTHFYLKGESTKSLEILEWGNTIYNGIDDCKIEKCKVLILEKRYYEALQVLSSLKNPDSPQALYEYAQIAILRNNGNEAKEYLRKIIEFGIAKDKLLIELTFFLATNHMMYFAQDCWDKISNLTDVTDDYKLSNIALEYELGHFNHALTLCKLHVKQNPNDIVACFYLTDLIFQSNNITSIKHMVAHSKRLHATSTFVLRIEKLLATILATKNMKRKDRKLFLRENGYG